MLATYWGEMNRREMNRGDMKTPADTATLVGMAIVRSPVGVGIEPFYGEVIDGMEDVLHKRGVNVLMQVVENYEEELATYRRWASTRAVSGVVLTNLTMNDERADLLSLIGLPGVTIGEPAASTGRAVVRVKNYDAMTAAVQQLVRLGHRLLARVSGPSELLHTRARTSAFDAAVAVASVSGSTYVGDYSAASGDAAFRWLMVQKEPPTAIIFDNDVMAVAALEAARERDVGVPDDVSLLAWDDSALCRMTTPQLSAMSHDVYELGKLAAQVLLSVLESGVATDVTAPEPAYIARGSTAPPRSEPVERGQSDGASSMP